MPSLTDALSQFAYMADRPVMFHSGLFWLLFVVFLPLFSWLRSRRTGMSVFVIAFSLYFYYLSSGIMVGLLIATSVADYAFSKLLARTQRKAVRRLLVCLSLLLSLGILFYFKYADFFMWNWNAMVGSNFAPMQLVLPVGISFYTFQSVSYVIDVYRRDIPPAESYLDYAFFLTFFPALVAGPIVRARDFLPQIRRNNPVESSMIYGGLYLVMLGVIKKAVLADYLAQFDDLVFDDPMMYSGFENMMAVIGYTMQIYFDFSGYSDMAIGLAAILGFRLAVNFDHPYRSHNLSQFWHKWHISLSSWLRDYVYIPLGGNRKGTARTYFNNLAVMLLAGLWHGAAWRFILWGGAHGVGLLVHKAIKNLRPRWLADSWANAGAWLLTMIYVALLWVFFRAPTFQGGWTMICRIFTDFTAATMAPMVMARYGWCIVLAVCIVYEALPQRWHVAGPRWFVAAPFPAKAVVLTAVVWLTLAMASQSVQPFIYYRF